jgi:hypothetical protein
MLARGERAAAAAELTRAARGQLPPALTLESRLLLVESCGEAPAGRLVTDRAAERARLEAARRRCAFEAAPGAAPR